MEFLISLIFLWTKICSLNEVFELKKKKVGFSLDEIAQNSFSPFLFVLYVL